jgi:hypothetical protein
LEEERDLALRKDPWFDYAEGLLQLAIVLTSVAIISNRRAMFYAAIVLGMVGSACTLNGYFLFTKLHTSLQSETDLWQPISINPTTW